MFPIYILRTALSISLIFGQEEEIEQIRKIRKISWLTRGLVVVSIILSVVLELLRLRAATEYAKELALLIGGTSLIASTLFLRHRISKFDKARASLLMIKLHVATVIVGWLSRENEQIWLDLSRDSESKDPHGETYYKLKTCYYWAGVFEAYLNVYP